MWQSEQARRYLEAVHGKDVWYKAPETFENLLEQWVWAVANGEGMFPDQAEKLGEECMSAIERIIKENDHYRLLP